MIEVASAANQGWINCVFSCLCICRVYFIFVNNILKTAPQLVLVFL